QAGHASGSDWAAQGNMLASDRAWHEMGAAFEQTTGTLAQRLLAALDAAEATGGDWRGRGGAGILVVPSEGDPWERVIDLRVEDGDGSLVELRRLLERALGYRKANRAEGDRAGVARAHGLPGTYVELGAIVDAAETGDVDAARALLAELERKDARWGDTVRSMSLLPDLASLRALFEE
ncbi:MAG TPA: DUF1028 domain-containing protein, partial [Gaiellaceae bacterium]|nr:DUF1028 domain-containing protein [Gaiellaceae bacterium]